MKQDELQQRCIAIIEDGIRMREERLEQDFPENTLSDYYANTTRPNREVRDERAADIQADKEALMWLRDVAVG